MQSAISNEVRQVELYLACRNLLNKDVFSKSDPQVWVYMLDNNKWNLKDKTEIINDNLNPTFTKTLILDYYFEMHQHLKFEVVDVDGPNSYELIGSVETELGKIMGSRNQLLILDLKTKSGSTGGKLICRCDNVGSSPYVYHMQWKGSKLLNTDKGFFNFRWFDKSDPLLRIMKNMGDGTTNDNWLKVYETESIHNNLNPRWQPFVISCDKLTSSDIYKRLKIECWDWEDNSEFQYIGEFEFTMNDIINLEKRKFELYSKKMKKATGMIELTLFETKEKYTFIHYLRGGLQLNVIVAIDFTGSNGVPSSPQSLHAITSNNSLNQYQQAISCVCDILLNYDYDKMIPVYGFGAKPHLPNLYSNQTLHCFPLTGDPNNAEVFHTNGIMEAYKSALMRLEFSGPTYFTPIFQEAAKVAQSQKNRGANVYNILLVITDGEIHDMGSTIDCIYEMAFLPISIIIIGVGNEDFENMRILDGDSGLYNSKRQKIPRDLVQFVAFKEFKNSLTRLSSEVLAEIPDQIVKYMELSDIKPIIPQNVDMSLNLSSIQGPEIIQNPGFPPNNSNPLAPFIGQVQQMTLNSPGANYFLNLNNNQSPRMGNNQSPKMISNQSPRMDNNQSPRKGNNQSPRMGNNQSPRMIPNQTHNPNHSPTVPSSPVNGYPNILNYSNTNLNAPNPNISVPSIPNFNPSGPPVLIDTSQIFHSSSTNANSNVHMSGIIPQNSINPNNYNKKNI